MDYEKALTLLADRGLYLYRCDETQLLGEDKGKHVVGWAVTDENNWNHGASRDRHPLCGGCPTYDVQPTIAAAIDAALARLEEEATWAAEKSEKTSRTARELSRQNRELFKACRA